MIEYVEYESKRLSISSSSISFGLRSLRMVTRIRMLCTLNMLSLFLSVLHHVAVRCSVECVSILSLCLESAC